MLTQIIDGFQYKITRNITRNDFYNLIVLLNEQMPQYKFYPTFKVEGGITLKDEQGVEKDIRFRLLDKRNGVFPKEWKWNVPYCVEEWKDDHEILFKRNQFLKTILYGYDDYIEFSNEELNLISSFMELIGFTKCPKTFSKSHYKRPW